VALPGQNPRAPYILVGSHVDSVPCGGNYDGLAGVIAGLLCLIRFQLSRTIPPQNVKLIALRAEESPWFETACLGSRALFGELASDLARKHRVTGRSLRDHLEDVGAAIGPIAAGQHLLSNAQIAGYYELHIEQGPVMIERNVPVAVVSDIRGILRLPAIKCLGEEGHSGAVPRQLRHDAVLAVVTLLHRMDQHWSKMLDEKQDLVITSGVLCTNARHHSPSRIAGEVTFSLDLRSRDDRTLKRVREVLAEEMRVIEQEQGVTFTQGTEYLTPSEPMDVRMRTHLKRLAEQHDIPFIEMASGSGHDAMVFARNGVPSAMIFVRNQNGSHNPSEAMEISDFLLGANLLYQALAEKIG
jgi:N-carbamoyl-L-amino-acid hydrolase